MNAAPSLIEASQTRHGRQIVQSLVFLSSANIAGCEQSHMNNVELLIEALFAIVVRRLIEIDSR